MGWFTEVIIAIGLACCLAFSIVAIMLWFE